MSIFPEVLTESVGETFVRKLEEISKEESLILDIDIVIEIVVAYA